MSINRDSAEEKKSNTGALLISDRVNSVIQKNRKIIFLGFGLILVGIITLITVLGIRERQLMKLWSRVEIFYERYENIMDSMEAVWDIEAYRESLELENLRAELSEFTANTSGFPAARVYSLIAGIYEIQEYWQEAEEAWAAAAAAAPGIYFAAVSYFRAALTAENQNDLISAIDYYAKAADMADVFPMAQRARFSMGRLQEAIGDNEAAIESYRVLSADWRDDQFWFRLAQSRILLLERE